jgi:hypothetical protein
MTKPIGATQKQLEENNIEWVLCGNYGHKDKVIGNIFENPELLK